MMSPATHSDDGNDWSAEGRNILSPERMAAIRKALEEKGPVIVEHWFYYGSRSPHRLVFEAYDDVVEYLKTKAMRCTSGITLRFAVTRTHLPTASIPTPTAACRRAGHIENGERDDGLATQMT